MGDAVLMMGSGAAVQQRGAPRTQAQRDRETFENEARILLSEGNALAAQTFNDARVRLAYQRQLQSTVNELRAAAQSGRITWAQAAGEAHRMRNETLGLMRGRSSPIGRAIAEMLKQEGVTYDALLARYSQRLFGQNAQFGRLSAAQQQQVHMAIVEAAARTRPNVNRWLRHGSRAARGLMVLSLGVAVYNVYTADDRAAAARREGAVLGAGLAGSVAAGALAGAIFGPPGALIGGLVGGAAAAFGVDYFW